MGLMKPDYLGREVLEVTEEELQAGVEKEHGICLCCASLIEDDGSNYRTICPYCAGFVISVHTAVLLGYARVYKER